MYDDDDDPITGADFRWLIAGFTETVARLDRDDEAEREHAENYTNGVEAALSGRIDGIEETIGDVSGELTVAERFDHVDGAIAAVSAQLNERVERKLNEVLANQARAAVRNDQLARVITELRHNAYLKETPEERAEKGLRIAHAIVSGECDLAQLSPELRLETLLLAHRDVAASSPGSDRLLRNVAAGALNLDTRLTAIAQDYVDAFPVPPAAEGA